MSLGFGVPTKWAPSGGFRSPVIGPVVARPVTVPVSITGQGTAQLTPRPDFKSFYDPSRVVDIDKLKVVADLRTEGSERGEKQSGDNGTLGPGSNNGAFISTGARTPVVETKTQTGLTGTQLAIIAAASFLILGG